MRIRSLRWTRYRVPFRHAFTTAHGAIEVREGLIVRLETDVGLVGHGEAAPLPDFAGGTVEDAVRLLTGVHGHLAGQDLNDAYELMLDRTVGTPAGSVVRCALDTALLDTQARAAGCRVADLLAHDIVVAVPVNATVGDASTEGAVEQARRAVEAGYRTVNLKVGIAGSPEAEEARVAAIRRAIGPAVALRLDANGAWTPDEAIALIRRLTAHDIELVEQPVPAVDLSGLARVRRAADVSIAADEAVTDLAAARAIIRAEAADVLIVKPMAVGGLRIGREIIALATSAGLGAIVTTTLDTGVGVAAALHLAATLPRPIVACGLATADLLVADLLTQPLTARDGQLSLLAGEGLGAAVNGDELARYAVAEKEPAQANGEVGAHGRRREPTGADRAPHCRRRNAK